MSTTANGSANTAKENIVIVGGGIIGCTTAYFITRHPKYDPNKHSVTILEATGIASGASGKAGGLLALWAYPSCLVPLSFKLHQQLADEHNGSERWGYRRLGVGSIECTGRPISDTRQPGKGEPLTGVHDSKLPNTGDGNISLQKRAADPSATKRLRNANLPSDLDWVSAESAQYYSPMGSPEDTAQVHPYQFTTSMASLASERGAKVVIGKCISLNPSAKTATYTTSDSSSPQTITATSLIVTAGPWTGTLLPRLPISSIRAHSVTITPSSPISAYALFTSIDLPRNYKANHPSRPKTVSPEIYARPGNSVYACGEGDSLVPLPDSTADVEVDDARCQDIIDYVSSISDELGDGEVTARQACYLPLVESGSASGPLVGKTTFEGVWVGAGHTCWGIQNGPATGKILAEMVMDGEARSGKIGSLDPRKAM